MLKIKENICIPALLFLISFSTAFYFMNEGLFHLDAIMLAQAIQETLETGTLHLYVQGRPGSVIINTILFLILKPFGLDIDFTLRFSSVLFHGLSIVAFYYFVYALFKNRIQAVFAALLLMFTQFYIIPNTSGKEHACSLFFLLSSFAILLSGMERKNFSLMALSSFLLIIAVTIRESILLLVPFYFLLYLHPTIQWRPFQIRTDQERFNFKSLLAVLIPFCLVFTIAFVTYFKDVLIKNMVIRDDGSMIFLGLNSFVQVKAIKDLMYILSFPLSVLWGMGFYLLIMNRHIFYSAFLFLWSLLFFYIANLSGYGPRHLDIIFLPIYIFSSYALQHFFFKTNKVFVYIFVTILVIRIFLQAYPTLSLRKEFNGLKHFAQFINTKTEENALILSMDISTFIEFYGKRSTMGHPINNIPLIQKHLHEVEQIVKSGRPVYLSDEYFSYDRPSLIDPLFHEIFELKFVGSALFESFHRSERGYKVFMMPLYRLNLKNTSTQTP